MPNWWATLSTLIKICGLVGAQYKENMMYKNQLAIAIKHNGKILRENKDLVQLPFGSEFSVLVKNLNSRRVKFTLHIDGTDVLDGTEIIVNANSETELKRFIRNGNMNEGNAFKFIERTKSIEDGPRGIKVDDGVVRVEFWFEQEAPTITKTVHHHYDEYHWGVYPYYKNYWYGPTYGTTGSIARSPTYSSNSAGISNVKLGSASATNGDSEVKTSGLLRGLNSATASTLSSTASALGDAAVAYNSAEITPTMDNYSPEVNEAGITVPGSKVQQSFTTVYGFVAESQSHVIVLRLAGKIGSVEIAAPITVKSKQKCETCGKVNKATSKFCSGCGTSLELL